MRASAREPLNKPAPSFEPPKQAAAATKFQNPKPSGTDGFELKIYLEEPFSQGFKGIPFRPLTHPINSWPSINAGLGPGTFKQASSKLRASKASSSSHKFQNPKPSGTDGFELKIYLEKPFSQGFKGIPFRPLTHPINSWPSINAGLGLRTFKKASSKLRVSKASSSPKITKFQAFRNR